MSIGDPMRRTGPAAVSPASRIILLISGLLVLERFADGPDRRAEDIDLLEAPDPVFGGVLRETLAEDRVEFGAMGHLRVEIGVARISDRSSISNAEQMSCSGLALKAPTMTMALVVVSNTPVSGRRPS